MFGLSAVIDDIWNLDAFHDHLNIAAGDGLGIPPPQESAEGAVLQAVMGRRLGFLPRSNQYPLYRSTSIGRRSYRPH